MFHNGHKDLIACLHMIQTIAVCYQIDTFGRISCENNFPRGFCANKIAHSFAGILVQICRFHAERIISAQWIRIVLFIKICLCIYDTLWALRSGSVVNVYPVVPNGCIFRSTDGCQQRKILSIIRHVTPPQVLHL